MMYDTSFLLIQRFLRTKSCLLCCLIIVLEQKIYHESTVSERTSLDYYFFK